MKANHAKQLNRTENDSFSSTTTIAALLFLFNASADWPSAMFRVPVVLLPKVTYPVAVLKAAVDLRS
jgi:hypothetical protein